MANLFLKQILSKRRQIEDDVSVIFDPEEFEARGYFLQYACLG